MFFACFHLLTSVTSKPPIYDILNSLIIRIAPFKDIMVYKGRNSILRWCSWPSCQNCSWDNWTAINCQLSLSTPCSGSSVIATSIVKSDRPTNGSSTLCTILVISACQNRECVATQPYSLSVSFELRQLASQC